MTKMGAKLKKASVKWTFKPTLSQPICRRPVCAHRDYFQRQHNLSNLTSFLHSSLLFGPLNRNPIKRLHHD